VLTVVTSSAELAMADLHDGDPLLEALQTIRGASTRAARLTAQLLAFSRQQILQPATFDLNEVVSALAPMLRRVVGDQVVLDLQPAAAAVTVRADRGNLEQVVLNVAINARDAMPDGGTVTIAVAVATLDAGDPGTALAPGRYAQLTVTDTGTGMSDDVRQRIFEPFFTTKDMGKRHGPRARDGVRHHEGVPRRHQRLLGGRSRFHVPHGLGRASTPRSPASLTRASCRSEAPARCWSSRTTRRSAASCGAI
jgi:two-component system cell cycle sensor histidine kinase/response regulator CckA